MVVGNPRCPLCKENFEGTAQFEAHKATPAHRAKWLMHWYNTQRVQLAGDKNGVEIQPRGQVNLQYDAAEGNISVSLQPGERKTFDLVVRNGLESAPVILRQVETLHRSKGVSISDQYDVTKNVKFVRLLSGIEYVIQCHVEGHDMDVEMVPIAFQFKSEKDDILFFIVRTVELVVVDNIARDAAPATSYERLKTKYYSRHDLGTYEPGVPVSRGPVASYKIPLEQYRYRAGLKHIVSHDFNPSKVGEHYTEEAKKLRNMMNEGLTFENYQQWFQTMLWAEEMQMERDIQFYSMKEARLKLVPPRLYSNAKCVELQVLGLAEKRPSILKGDSVFVMHVGTKKPVYEGIVHQVNDKSVYLAFGSTFMRSFIDNTRVTVEFTFNRFPLRVSHRSVQLSREMSLNHLIFPTYPRTSTSAAGISPYNRKIENNPEQMEAIANIIAGTSKPAPYIIFGPPGTGKTVTVVEAIKQVFFLQKSSVVLAAAPSNSAVDLLTRRLLEHIPKRHMLRMHAPSRSVYSIPSELLEISNVDDHCIYIPDQTEFLNCRIIICTFVTASRIASASLPSGFITHVFLDECGHAMEPESMAALAGIVEGDSSQVVLAGDPYQLGPVIRNRQCYSSGKHFMENGLDKSYLERLMQEKIYQPDESGIFNKRVVTKLLNNYRSHHCILKESNELFYNNELKACADPVLVNSLCNWDYLPNPNFPLVFHGARGKDEREGNSPSYFNPIEVSHVVTYTRNLLDSRNPKIAAKDIGIISPYRRQVEKIRDQLNKARILKDIKVGSPEEFQGDERRVIIISCVRASSNQLALDDFFKLGFLRNPKRFNVAVTRAKSLLIVIGCPDILQLDPHWSKLLSYIHENGGYRGDTLMSNSLDFDDILERFNRLDLRPLLVDEGVGAREIAEAPEWRVEG